MTAIHRQPKSGATGSSGDDAAPAPTEQAFADAAKLDTTMTQGLAALPENTDLIVVSADGESVPLPSTDAAGILATGDPMWCPAGVAPVAGAGGCSPAMDLFGTILGNPATELLAWLFANEPNKAGVIWVEDDYRASTALGGPDNSVTFSGSDFTSMKNYALTIKGGWTGTSSGTIDHGVPSQFDFGALSIIDWVGSITINDIVVSGAGTNPNGIFDSYHPGLLVITQGSIKLDRVEANNNSSGGTDMAGAYLDNTSGTGNVSVSNSHFNNNDQYGLDVFSKGTITLKNVAADGNDNWFGANLDNHTAADAKNVSISNSEFKGNSTRGLEIYSKGAVTLNNVTSIYNGNTGALINNTYFGSSPVAVKGVNIFSNNDSYGLSVDSYGAITLSNTTANFNTLTGVYLDNCQYSFGCTATGNPGVTISGSLTAIGNSYHGLTVYSRGTVSGKNLTLNDNGQVGAFIDNCGFVTACTGVGGVTLSGNNVFNNNGFEGLAIYTLGAAKLSNLIAINNGTTASYTGVSIFAGDPTHQSPVTITGYNLIKGNKPEGLSIRSYGAVTLSNITADTNSATGVYIDNTGGLYPIKPVMVKGFGVFNFNGGQGLYINSQGAITLSNLTAHNNGQFGLSLSNDSSPSQAGMTIKGYAIAEWNGYTGLYIQSHGKISLVNVNANYNYGTGAEVHTQGITGPSSVTISGTNNFICNGLSGRSLVGDCTSSYLSAEGGGLVVYADGAITISNITANYNTGYGARLDNQSNWLAQNNQA